MISFAKGMVMSCICVWGCCLTGIILSHWDWWFFFVGVVSYARAVLIFYRHEFRTDMKALLKIFGHKFDDKQKILLQAASGIVLPSMLSLSEIKRRDPALLQIFTEVLNITLLIMSVIYRQYHITATSILIFLSGYGFWLWQSGPFYSGNYSIDSVNAIVLYLRARGDSLREFDETLITIFYKITMEMFTYELLSGNHFELTTALRKKYSEAYYNNYGNC